MKIKLYQINADRDTESMMYESLERITRVHQTVRPEIYDKVFEGEVDCRDLESLYREFNSDDRPGADRFRSISVSDVVSVKDPETGKESFYFCDSIGFSRIDFDAEKTHNLPETTIRVVLVEPGKKARLADIDPSLEGMYRMIDTDMIQAVYPFEDEVCIVCDEEGKLKASPPNRALRYEGSNEIYDIVVGTFFVCSCEGHSFGSLNAEQQQRYLEQYKWPEAFISMNGRIDAIPIKPHERDNAR